MTDKKDDYEYKDLLLEVGLPDDEEFKDLLKDLSAAPSRYGHAEPPAGYENQLMAALRTRLPLENQTPSVARSTQPGFLSRFMASSKFAWGFSGAMAVFVGIFAFQSLRQVEAPEASVDFLAQTAQRGSSEAVERWLASVADLGVRAHKDTPSGVAEELSNVDPALANQALEDVARSLGYKEGI